MDSSGPGSSGFLGKNLTGTNDNIANNAIIGNVTLNTVPEPGGALLLIGSLFPLMIRRRR